MVLCRVTHNYFFVQTIYRAIRPCMKTSLRCYGGQQVKSNQHLDICLVSTQESKREGEARGGEQGVISMQQTVCCISAILMWWSRPEHRQTALSSSSPLWHTSLHCAETCNLPRWFKSNRCARCLHVVFVVPLTVAAVGVGVRPLRR